MQCQQQQQLRPVMLTLRNVFAAALQCLTIRNNGLLEWELGSNRIIEVSGLWQYACSKLASPPAQARIAAEETEQLLYVKRAAHKALSVQLCCQHYQQL